MNFNIPSPKNLRDTNEGIIAIKVEILVNEIICHMKNFPSSHKGFSYSITAEQFQIAERVCNVFNESGKWQAMSDGNWGCKGEYIITLKPLE